jgi:hypothetical protein
MKYYTILYIILLVCLSAYLIFIYFYLSLGFKKVGFQNYNNVQWSNDLIKRFNIYQTTINKNVNQFDLSLLQKQATPEEAEEYIKTGKWEWSNELKDLYIETIWSSPIIKIDPQIALDYAMSIYNKNAVTELLAWNTKEGEFLLYGGKIDPNTSIKCSYDNQSVIQKQTFLGTTNNLKPEDIPKEFPGFSFINGPCNPCSVFDDLDKTNSITNNKCPFKLDINGDNNVSPIWEKIWKL